MGNSEIKTCDVKRSQEEDVISKLPDFLISDIILSHLSTKDATRTSVLSTRWRNLWKLVPGLDLDSRAFSNLEAFVNFVDRFFDSHIESWILKLKLSIHGSDDDGTNFHLNSWIDSVTNKCKIQQLEVRFGDFTDHPSEIPMSVYTCETLVQLHLCHVALVDAEFFSLPCLKIMDLICVKYNASTMEKLISCSPVLEDLTISTNPFCSSSVVQVCSQTLKRIQINALTKVVIDAPLIQSLKTHFFEENNYKIISLGFPVKLVIDVILLERHNTIYKSVVCDILTNISKVRELVIGRNMWKEIFLYSKTEPLPQFGYLSRLNAQYFKSDMELLPTLLESCPNLESLILKEREIYGRREEKEPNVMFSTVPQCLVSSLKYVELKRLSAYEGAMELVRYLLKNSAILKTLRLQNYDTKKEKYEILEEILAMPRCSRSCEVLIS